MSFITVIRESIEDLLIYILQSESRQRKIFFALIFMCSMIFIILGVVGIKNLLLPGYKTCNEAITALNAKYQKMPSFKHQHETDMVNKLCK